MITALIDEIKKDARGAFIMRDWLGEGAIPVSPMQAEFRANICQACPENIEKNWWDRVKGHIAEFIKETVATKNKLDLHVVNEEGLAMCKVCGCCLQTKIWVPIKHVADHTTVEQLASFPIPCWQKDEILRHLTPQEEEH